MSLFDAMLTLVSLMTIVAVVLATRVRRPNVVLMQHTMYGHTFITRGTRRDA